ncbi:MAG: ferredoxin--nitrite reductase [Synechococcus sp. XM-24]|nr:MAG: ferredoxin--nitrite reductase [Synechococcus sp. XM-24]
MSSSTTQQKRDVFSRFVNWLSSSGNDKAAVNRPQGSQDIISRLMNRISG